MKVGLKDIIGWLSKIFATVNTCNNQSGNKAQASRV